MRREINFAIHQELALCKRPGNVRKTRTIFVRVPLVRSSPLHTSSETKTELLAKKNKRKKKQKGEGGRGNIIRERERALSSP